MRNKNDTLHYKKCWRAEKLESYGIYSYRFEHYSSDYYKHLEYIIRLDSNYFQVAIEHYSL